MFEHLIGKTSEKVFTTVERGAVKKFAEAIGEEHPLFINPEYGKLSKYGDNIAPSTFPRTFDYGTIEGLDLPKTGLIHGEQSFDYERPLMVGESFYCFTEVDSYVEKTTHSGRLGFLSLRNTGEDLKGELLFTSRIVIIFTEKVREGILNGDHSNT